MIAYTAIVSAYRIKWNALSDSPFLFAAIPECHGFLGGEVDDDEAIYTSLSTICQQFILSISQHRVVVSHEQDWGSEASSPGFSHHLEC